METTKNVTTDHLAALAAELAKLSTEDRRRLADLLTAGPEGQR